MSIPCNVSCGVGVMKRVRSCDQPCPSRDGLKCLLSNGSMGRAMVEVKEETCHAGACPGKQGFVVIAVSHYYEVNSIHVFFS